MIVPIPAYTCPACGERIDHPCIFADAAGPTPEAGDLTCCPYCLTMLVFVFAGGGGDGGGGGLAVRLPTAAEAFEVAMDDELSASIEAHIEGEGGGPT